MLLALAARYFTHFALRQNPQYRFVLASRAAAAASAAPTAATAGAGSSGSAAPPPPPPPAPDVAVFSPSYLSSAQFLKWWQQRVHQDVGRQLTVSSPIATSSADSSSDASASLGAASASSSEELEVEVEQTAEEEEEQAAEDTALVLVPRSRWHHVQDQLREWSQRVRSLQIEWGESITHSASPYPFLMCFYVVLRVQNPARTKQCAATYADARL
jgi:hypothetical protein